MRVDAAEFIPGEVRQPTVLSASSPEFVLSASSPEFVPGTAVWTEDSLEAWVPEAPKKVSELDEVLMKAGEGVQAGFGDTYMFDEHPPIVHMDEDEFLTPVPWEDPEPSEEVAQFRFEGRLLKWDVPGVWDELRQMEHGKSLESARFCVAGNVLRVAFFPAGATYTSDGDCAVALLSDEKTKLKFELFLNDRSSGTKVLLGSKFSCDFRTPRIGGQDGIVIGVQVHENLVFGMGF
uniref:Uncharacterized protein n=1 Tax=Noctiluca scintillans TaxID=2966 RepID=A0A7S1AK76_NOCSC